MTFEPGYSYYAVHRDPRSIDLVWDWVSTEQSCSMYRGHILSWSTWIAQIPSGQLNTLFALYHSEHVDLL